MDRRTGIAGQGSQDMDRRTRIAGHGSQDRDRRTWIGPGKFEKALPPKNQLSIRIASSNRDEIFFGASQYTQLSKDIENAALLRRGRMLQVQIHATFSVTATVYRHIYIEKRTERKKRT